MGANQAYYAEYDDELGYYLIYRKDGTKLGIKTKTLEEVGTVFQILADAHENAKIRKSNSANNRPVDRQRDRIYPTRFKGSS